MACVDKMHVLAEFQPFLTILSVFNWDNFYGAHRISNIFRAIFLTMVITMEITTSILLFWYWVDEHYSLYSLAVSTAIVGTQMIAANITMMTINRRIGEAINHTQMVINSRNSDFFVYFPRNSLKRRKQCRISSEIRIC